MSKPRNYSPAEWEDKKSIIYHLYIEKNEYFKNMTAILVRDHDFHPTKNKLVEMLKQWGFKKNTKAEKWQSLSLELKRKGINLDTVDQVEVDGLMMTSKKLKKEIARHGTYSASTETESNTLDSDTPPKHPALQDSLLDNPTTALPTTDNGQVTRSTTLRTPTRSAGDNDRALEGPSTAARLGSFAVVLNESAVDTRSQATSSISVSHAWSPPWLHTEPLNKVQRPDPQHTEPQRLPMLDLLCLVSLFFPTEMDHFWVTTGYTGPGVWQMLYKHIRVCLLNATTSNRRDTEGLRSDPICVQIICEATASLISTTKIGVQVDKQLDANDVFWCIEGVLPEMGKSTNTTLDVTFHLVDPGDMVHVAVCFFVCYLCMNKLVDGTTLDKLLLWMAEKNQTEHIVSTLLRLNTHIARFLQTEFLHAAIRTKNRRLAIALLDAKVDQLSFIEMKGFDGYLAKVKGSPLQAAIVLKDVAMARSFLAAGVEVHALYGGELSSTLCGSPLSLVVRFKESLGLLDDLIDSFVPSKDSAILLHAIRSGVDLNTIRLLIRRGADMNDCFRYERTVLSVVHVASIKGNVSILEYFLNQGLDADGLVRMPLAKHEILECKDDCCYWRLGGSTPLTLAVEHGNTAAALLLLERGANANLVWESESSIASAVSMKRFVLIENLVAHTTELPRRSYEIMVTTAIRHNDIETIEWLLQDAGMSAWESVDWEPIVSIAAAGGNVDVMRCIITKWTNITNQNNGQNFSADHVVILEQALRKATNCNQVGMMRMLIVVLYGNDSSTISLRMRESLLEAAISGKAYAAVCFTLANCFGTSSPDEQPHSQSGTIHSPPRLMSQQEHLGLECDMLPNQGTHRRDFPMATRLHPVDLSEPPAIAIEPAPPSPQGELTHDPLSPPSSSRRESINSRLLMQGPNRTQSKVTSTQSADIPSLLSPGISSHGASLTVNHLSFPAPACSDQSWVQRSKNILVSLAAASNLTATIATLLSDHASPDGDSYANQWCQHPLASAIDNDNTEVLSLLLQHSADVSACKGYSKLQEMSDLLPAEMAVLHNKPEVLKALRSYNQLEVRQHVISRFWTNLISSSSHFDLEIIRFLLGLGGWNTVDVCRIFAWAFRQGPDSDSLAALFANHGVSISSSQSIWSTPLQSALMNRKFAFARGLVAAGADVDAVGGYCANDKGSGSVTALEASCYQCHVASVNLLLENGAAAIHYSALSGPKSALEIASANGFLSIVQILADAVAVVHPPYILFDTAIMCAARDGRVDTLALVLEHYDGATSIDQAVKQAMYFARLSRQDLVVNYLSTKYPNSSTENG